MALTVRELAQLPELGVHLIAGAAPGAPDPITWVHVSELDDPTPFLSGGELLLTTGLFVRDGLDLAGYVGKLRDAGVRGLGFGVGLSFAEIPDELVRAADALGLPLLRVPRRTPFIALSRAVSSALAADEYAAVARTFTAQQELTRAALSPQTPARLIRLLARKIDGWAVLLDERGAALATSSERAAAVVPVVAVEVARLRDHRGSIGAGFEIDVDGRTDTVSLQPVGAGTRRRGFLAVGRPGPLPSADRHLVNAAVMLLTLGFEQDATRPDALAEVRSVALDLALDGHLDLARTLADRVGATWPPDPLVVLVAPARPAPPSRADHPLPRADHPLPRADHPLPRADQRPASIGTGGTGVNDFIRADGRRGWAGPSAGRPGRPTGTATSSCSPPPTGPRRRRPNSRPSWPPRPPPPPRPHPRVPHPASSPASPITATAAAPPTGPPAGPADPAAGARPVGRSAPTPATRLPAALTQARQAAAAAAARGLPTLGFDAIATTGIEGLWDPRRAAAFAASLLAPLVEHDRTGRGELVASLRAWLEHHGQWDPAAAALGVHRHTLRRRMTLAGQLLGRDLDSPTVRSELWLALQLLG
ncbi:MAG: PucR family transcriptional regulator [Nakamurella multipartita]